MAVPKGFEAQISELRSSLPEISALATRLSSLEDNFKGMSKELIEATDARKASDSSIREDFTKHVDSSLRILKKDIDEGRSIEIKTAVADLNAELKRIKDVEGALKALGRFQKISTEEPRSSISGIQGQLQSDEPEIRLMSSRLADLEKLANAHSKELIRVSESRKSASSSMKDDLTRYVDANMKVLRREIDERRTEDIKASLSQFKDELKRVEFLNQELSVFKKSQEARTNELSDGLASMSGPVAELRSLSRNVAELEGTITSLDKRLDSEEDTKSEGLNNLENRINLMEKSIGDFSKSQAGLEKRVAQDNKRLQRALGEVMSDKKSLEQEFTAQRQKMSNLIKELRSL